MTIWGYFCTFEKFLSYICSHWQKCKRFLGKSLLSGELQPCFAENLWYTQPSELVLGICPSHCFHFSFMIIFSYLPVTFDSCCAYWKDRVCDLCLSWSCFFPLFKDLKNKNIKKLGWQCLWFLWAVIWVFIATKCFLWKNQLIVKVCSGFLVMSLFPACERQWGRNKKIEYSCYFFSFTILTIFKCAVQWH